MASILGHWTLVQLAASVVLPFLILRVKIHQLTLSSGGRGWGVVFLHQKRWQLEITLKSLSFKLNWDYCKFCRCHCGSTWIYPELYSCCYDFCCIGFYSPSSTVLCQDVCLWLYMPGDLFICNCRQPLNGDVSSLYPYIYRLCVTIDPSGCNCCQPQECNISSVYPYFYGRCWPNNNLCWQISIQLYL